MFKKLMTLVFAVVICGQALAQSEPKVKSCTELHYDQSMNKMIKARKLKRGLVFGGMAGFTVFGLGAAFTGGYAALAALSSVSTNVAWGSFALFVGAGVTPAPQIQNYINREASKLKRKIRKGAPGITDAQIEVALSEGYDSGDFCQGGSLMSLKEITNTVITRFNPDGDCPASMELPGLNDLQALD